MGIFFQALLSAVIVVAGLTAAAIFLLDGWALTVVCVAIGWIFSDVLQHYLDKYQR